MVNIVMYIIGAIELIAIFAIAKFFIGKPLFGKGYWSDFYNEK